MNSKLMMLLFVIFISIYGFNMFPTLKRVDSTANDDPNRVQNTTPNQLNLKNRIALTNYLRQLDNKYSTFNVAKVRFGKRSQSYPDFELYDEKKDNENDDNEYEYNNSYDELY